jgi:hypothetical protein
LKAQEPPAPCWWCLLVAPNAVINNSKVRVGVALDAALQRPSKSSSPQRVRRYSSSIGTRPALAPSWRWGGDFSVGRSRVDAQNFVSVEARQVR